MVRLETLSAAAAEEAIARVWRVLEAHRIATPRLRVTHHARVTHHSGVCIELSFTSSADAELAAEALRSAALAVSTQRVS